jgi:hypothetical protein
LIVATNKVSELEPNAQTDRGTCPCVGL